MKSLGITPSPVQGEYVLTPGSEVGAIQLPDLSIVIQPKLPIDRLLFLISYTFDPRHWRDVDFDLAERSDILEAIVPALVRHARRAFLRGLLQGYRTEEEALTTIRGRLRFDDQIRRHFGDGPPAEVRYDEFTEDIEPNRLIKAAVRRLGRMRLRSTWSRRSLEELNQALERVAEVEYHPRSIPKVMYSRLNEHYRPAVELARLVLASRSYELGHGLVKGSTFLIDMNRVFEDFVIAALRDVMNLSVRTFPQGSAGRSLHLAISNRVRLRPDLSWWENSECLFVGDVKYKRLSVAGYQHPDLYQLLAYTVATELPGGLLVYAEGEHPEVAYRVRHAEKELEIVTLALDGTPAEVLDQIRDVARRIVQLRSRALEARRSAA